MTDTLDGAAVVATVRETLRTGRAAAVPRDRCPPELDALLADIAGLYAFALGLAQGDLELTTTSRGAVVGALKSLQASLRHLSWQTQRVAAGDFSQHVDFMGEFADAFNSMVASLATARSQLADKNEVLSRLNARLEVLATTDQLTGASNRHKLEEVLLTEMTRAERHDLDLTIIMLDIDHFKRVNDACGHKAGDAVLREVSALVAAQLRASDVHVRWGGEEFLAVAPHTNAQQGARLAERMRAKVAAHAFPGVGKLTTSFGVAALHIGESADQFIARADAALYLAKNNGRDRVETAG